MSNKIFYSSYIRGISVSVPKDKVNLHEFHFDDTDTEEIIKLTGIHEIRKAPDNMTQLDYCIDAANHLISELDFDKSQIDGVVFSTTLNDYITPGNAYLMQDLLDLKPETVLIDLNQACAGFVNGLLQASMLIETGYCKNVLVCAGDKEDSINPRDKSLKMLMGDGDAVAIVSAKENSPASTFAVYNDGRLAKVLYTPGGGKRMNLRFLSQHPEYMIEEKPDAQGNFHSVINSQMDGLEVMAFAMDAVPDAINAVIKNIGWNKNDVGMFAFHQANELLLKTLAKRCRIPLEKLPITLKYFGNTAGNSIPLTLVLLAENNRALNNWNKVVMCGFGNGLACAAAALSLKDTYFSKLHEI